MKSETDDRHDPELRGVLREWKAPAFPLSLEERVLGPRRSWIQFLLRGSIRVPVPVVACLSVLLILGVWRISVRAEPGAPCATQIQPRQDSCKSFGSC